MSVGLPVLFSFSFAISLDCLPDLQRSGLCGWSGHHKKYEIRSTSFVSSYFPMRLSTATSLKPSSTTLLQCAYLLSLVFGRGRGATGGHLGLLDAAYLGQRINGAGLSAGLLQRLRGRISDKRASGSHWGWYTTWVSLYILLAITGT